MTAWIDRSISIRPRARRTLRVVFAASLLVALSCAVGCSKEEEESEDPGPKVTVPDRPAPEEEEPEAAEADGAAPTVAPETPPDKRTARAAAPDAEPASEEAAARPVDAQARRPRRTTSVETSILKVAPMLDKKDIREATGYAGLLQEADVVGQAADSQYNAARWESEDAEDFGFSLEVWKPGSAGAASKRFDQLYSQSMGGEKTRDLGDQSFRTEHHALRSIVFLDRRRSAVGAVTCGRELCSFDQLADLSRRVHRKL